MIDDATLIEIARSVVRPTQSECESPAEFRARQAAFDAGVNAALTAVRQIAGDLSADQ